MDRQTALKILELREGYSEDELKMAYRRACLRHHPDKTRSMEDGEMFHSVQEAHLFLKNEEAASKDAMFVHPDLFNFLLWFALNICRPKERPLKERPPKEHTELLVNVTLKEVYEAAVKRLVYKRVDGGSCTTDVLFLELIDFRESYLIPGKGDNGGDLLVKTQLTNTADYYLDDLMCGHDLYLTCRVGMYEHYFGLSSPISLPNNEFLPLEKHEPSNPLPKVESWVGRGLPYEDDEGRVSRGCLYVIYEIDTRAHKLSVEHRDILRDLFPPRENMTG